MGITEIKLIKSSSDKGREQVTLWVDGSVLHEVRVVSWKPGAENKKKSHGKPEKAQEALQAEVAALLDRGFAYRDGPPKAAPEKKKTASKPKPVVKPKWLERDEVAGHRKKLASLVKKAGLSHRFDEIEALAKPSIQFSLKKASSAPLGVSRIGGAPEVEVPGKLHFVAQIAVADVHALDLEGLLPARGLLSFFAQLDEGRDDYAEVGKVVHTDGGIAPSKSASSRIRGIGLLTPKLILTLPYYEDPVIDKLALTDDEREAYHDEVYLAFMPEEPAHLVAGYASAGTEHSLEGRTFLAQFASDDRIGFNEGDDQTLRFFFRGKKADFASVVCTLEEA